MDEVKPSSACNSEHGTATEIHTSQGIFGAETQAIDGRVSDVGESGKDDDIDKDGNTRKENALSNLSDALNRFEAEHGENTPDTSNAENEMDPPPPSSVATPLPENEMAMDTDGEAPEACVDDGKAQPEDAIDVSVEEPEAEPESSEKTPVSPLMKVTSEEVSSPVEGGSFEKEKVISSDALVGPDFLTESESNAVESSTDTEDRVTSNSLDKVDQTEERHSPGEVEAHDSEKTAQDSVNRKCTEPDGAEITVETNSSLLNSENVSADKTSVAETNSSEVVSCENALVENGATSQREDGSIAATNSTVSEETSTENVENEESVDQNRKTCNQAGSESASSKTDESTCSLQNDDDCCMQVDSSNNEVSSRNEDNIIELGEVIVQKSAPIITMNSSLMSPSVTKRTEKRTEPLSDDSCESILPPGGSETDVVARAAQVDPESLPLNSTPICAYCKQEKACSVVYGQSWLCSENCQTAIALKVMELGALRFCIQCQTRILETRITWQAMDFCTEFCLSHFQTAMISTCTHCHTRVSKENMGKFCVRFGEDIKQFCGRSCLKEHSVGVQLCSYCQVDLAGASLPCIAFGERYCSSDCVRQSSKVRVPRVDSCAVCGTLKEVAVEVRQGPKLNALCSEPCFAAFKFVNNLSEGRCDQCIRFFDKNMTDKMLIFSEQRTECFCSKTCLNVYICTNRHITSCDHCKVKKYSFDMIYKGNCAMMSMTVCSLHCLKNRYDKLGLCSQCGGSVVSDLYTASDRKFCSRTCLENTKAPSAAVLPPKNGKVQKDVIIQAAPQIIQQIIAKPAPYVEVKNKAILCKPFMHNKGTSCRPMPCHKETQTCDMLDPPKLIPIPVPIYIPTPMAMYSTPFPVPIPIPLAVPVPLFIPTTRNSAKGIMKEIKKIHEKMPADPFEAELLMMAEMVAGEKKADPTDSESDGEGQEVGNDVTESYSPEPVDASNSFGDDIMQMALFASDLAEPQVDMESVLTSNTITPSQQPTVDKSLYSEYPVAEEPTHVMSMRGRKRPMRGARTPTQQNKRGRRSATPNEGMGMHHAMGNMQHMPPPEPQRMEVEKPDANMRLKYTFGVNAWRHWVMQKNQELEKAMLSNRKIKPFKPDLLQLTADELNFSLCLFVKEVKKPNGQEYAPDTIYYLCLGVQQYLFENGRIDNIFTDTYYEKFTDCLDEVAKKFAALYNDSQYIVTRVEEEHLWESKQLGAHSPHVLLSTLMFFNTKHFNLVTVEEHMQLSFSHIMKHWKRNPNAPGVAKVPGSRNVLLRFYPPQSALEANSRKKKVYEQQENEDNPLRCPVKLYEFYLSKCPESVKTRNDVFYLLPERSCVPDSPVWYSTMALGKEPLMKMLHRVKMVKEINVALLTS